MAILGIQVQFFTVYVYNNYDIHVYTFTWMQLLNLLTQINSAELTQPIHMHQNTYCPKMTVARNVHGKWNLMIHVLYNGQIMAHLSRCSTPTSSASSAPISLATCSNVFVVGVPSWTERKRNLTGKVSVSERGRHSSRPKHNSYWFYFCCIHTVILIL